MTFEEQIKIDDMWRDASFREIFEESIGCAPIEPDSETQLFMGYHALYYYAFIKWAKS